MKKNYILQTLVLLFFVFAANAQRGINYKAIIKDGEGAAIVNTAVTVQFTILENGTTEVYKETHTPTTDANGIVIVNIGEGTVASGVFNDIDWVNHPHFLKTEIDKGEGLTDMGTTEFKAVPYAFHAKTAEYAATKADVDNLKSRIEYLENFIGASLLDNDIDDDGDGFTENDGDCNDLDDYIYPDATEVCGDNIDQDCDGLDLECSSGNDFGGLIFDNVTLLPEIVTSSEPSIHEVQLYCDQPFDPDSLTHDGLVIFNDENSGGSSQVSYAVAMDVLKNYVDGRLYFTRSEIQYENSSWTEGFDFIINLYNELVGISVARAITFPPDNAFSLPDSQQLLEMKLTDIKDALIDVIQDQKPLKGLLLVFTPLQKSKENLKTALSIIDPSILHDTIILIVLTSGQCEAIYY